MLNASQLVTASPGSLAFGKLRLDLKRRVLISAKGERRLRERVFALLLVFLESNGALVTDEMLTERVWGGKPVTKSNLDMHIFMLRKLLAQADSETEYVVTVHKKGHLFAFVPTSYQPAGDELEPSSSPATDAREACALAHCVDAYCLLEQRRDNTLRPAAEAFSRALDADPEYAPAHLGLARVYVSLGFYGDIPAQVALAHAMANHNRALKYGAETSEALAVSADIQLLFKWDRPSAQRHITQALLRDRSSVTTRSIWVRHLICAGEYDAALSESLALLRRFPQVPSLRVLFGEVLLMRGEVADAIDALSRALQVEREHAVARLHLAQAFVLNGAAARAVELLTRDRQASERELPWLVCARALAGDQPGALAGYDELCRKNKTRHVSPFALAVAACALGAAKDAQKLVAQSIAMREPAALLARCAPSRRWFEALSGTVEFEELLRQLPPLGVDEALASA
jgi:DNA-binding winged helix-turn-helix (wHTH) protein/cytochrome c-type biogenesis protein CcmH/NrfG